ncbi:ATP-binding protein [Agrilutibacter solisilvae]|uniref:Sensory/regulatory protein RpfC n=1 Tax=Agrilutibacter solisilvae TaxID=2763317 RepID=A0A974Y2B1_9GAMM|nr:ATP-binding protein [Lysobacter solisilvae]QSX79110.1 response regulator [Lysobacter solisilvae]
MGRFADTRLFPAIDPVTARLQLLSNLATARADAVVETNLRDNRRVSALRTGLSLGALLLAALIGRRVLRRAYRGVESLTFLARRMRQHDYTAQPGYVPSGGELGTVMDAFLEMRQDVLGFETELTQQLARNEHTRAELERRESFQRSLLDAAQVAIIAMDGQGRWTVFNSFAERLLGWRADEVVGRVPRHSSTVALPDDAPLMIPRESAQKLVDEVSQRLGRPVHHDWTGMYELAELNQPPAESRLLHKDGREVPVLLALAALHDDDGRRTGLIAVATDLTEREQLEAELRESEARAQAASHAKSSFLAAMSHEIRTPMIGVTGMLEVLAHSRLDTDQRHAINVIQQSSQSLLQIIGDILDFSKIEAGRLEISPSVVSLEAVVRSTVANYTGAASSKGLNLTCQVDDRVSLAHRADALRLRQILGNFLSNAIKFTAAGHVEVALEWTGESAPAPGAPLGGDLLSFRVSDTGIGVDAQAQQRLFQPFSQAHQDTTREYGGTGLGLAICTRLAELMGGMVTMASAPGAGTTMRLNLTLPRAPQDELATQAVASTRAAEFRPRPLPDPAQAEREGSLVLLADDHPTNRMVIARQLALAGYASEAAADGVQALEQWRSGRFALVLSDVHMPEMDGYALAGAIRAEERARALPRTPVVALTASALKGEAERCLAAGMDDYLAKPVSVPVLAACLRRWLPHTASDAGEGAMDGPLTDTATTGGLPQLDLPQVLDPAALAEFGDDPRAQAAVLRDFMDTTTQDLHALAHARDHVDTAGLAREAHKLKGAARLVGAGEVAQAASELEAAAPQADWSALLPLVTQVETAVQRLSLFVASRYPA